MTARSKIIGLLIGGAVAALACGAAQADVVISNKPTKNMSCAAGVCTATAKKAVLNVADLAAMLASGDVEVATGGGAKVIDVEAALSWTGTEKLTLTANQGVTVKKPVTVAGPGALTIATYGGSKTDLEFFNKGSIQFWDLSSDLTINGQSYTLVGDIHTLANDIADNPSGFYALAKPYDAKADGIYSDAPIPTTFNGTFDGLGNAISRLNIKFPANQNDVFVGLFRDTAGTIRNFGLERFRIQGGSCGVLILGGIATINEGLIDRSHVSGDIQIVSGCNGSIGGSVGGNFGTISNSYANVAITLRVSGFNNIGGLVGLNAGTVAFSFAGGSIGSVNIAFANVGGLVGENDGVVANTFSTTSVHDRRSCCSTDVFDGGLVGLNSSSGTISDSYASGKMHISDDEIRVGGLIGTDNAASGSIASTYWNLDLGVGDPSKGAGNVSNDPGITGLTTPQLQTGLPQGFDASIWEQKPDINNGMPYLRGVPFQQ